MEGDAVRRPHPKYVKPQLEHLTQFVKSSRVRPLASAPGVSLSCRKRPNLRRGLNEGSRNETLRLIKVSISRHFAPQENDGRRRCASPTSKICKVLAKMPDTICKIRPWCSRLLLRRQACRFRAGSVQI